MFFLIRRIKNHHYWFRDIVELNNLWKSSNVNLNRGNINNFNWSKYSTQTELSLPDKNIKKYIQSISEAYKTTIQKKNPEFTSIIEIQEVSYLLRHRCEVEESINNLIELGNQDEEMKKLGKEEYTEYCNILEKIDEELLEIIADNLGRDPCRDIIFEITAGIGGQEAMLFTADLCKMYAGYFSYIGFTYDVTEINEDSEGGIRHASFFVSGERAFELLRHEGGVHRVQRNPTTDKSGRIHTSTVSVVVLPQPTDIEINITPKDLKIETMRSSAPGGQNVNKTESAVRVTHLPTGVAIEAQTQRSQIQNKSLALQKLRAKLYDMELKDQKENTASMKKKQRGMSQRNEKIRTYNFNQDRITDHRLTDGTMHNLKGFLDGGEELKILQERLQKKLQLQLLHEAIEKCK
ncbi:peptide chain release factor 1 [Chelonus insularis]|uniref:peptide chain release factor 1 n=1 Tax=Chelonus insularis TaxID=460826 RepID=UPI00158D76F9|nr:peptide chain release factor 1 [Chelonus insularis]